MRIRDHRVNSNDSWEALIEAHAEQLVISAYRGLLHREPDREGLRVYRDLLRQERDFARLLKVLSESDEHRKLLAPHDSRPQFIAGKQELPNLIERYPDKYIRVEGDSSVFVASGAADFEFLEHLIAEHQFYDSFGVWTPQIDLDKRTTAAIVLGLGASSCLELGCFNGPVLSVLDHAGVSVCGIETSHLAFLLAYANVRRKMIFGDLTSLRFDRQYDVVLAMDVLEHISPLKLGNYLESINKLVPADGFIYINSPMFGHDDVFGGPFDIYLPEWRSTAEEGYWHHLHCNGKGWPQHGHLIWASPAWWEQEFLKYGFERAREIEHVIHSELASFFEHSAPARRSLFVLRHVGRPISSKDLQNMRIALAALREKESE